MVKKLFNNKGLPREASAKWGFTLLELLVVIGIISILVATGVASYSTVQKKARDAKRKSDLKDVQVALEQFHSVCGSVYPEYDSTGLEGVVSNGNGGLAIKCANPQTTIMEEMPKDPKLNTYYQCKSGSTCNDTQYTLCATLETEEDSPGVFKEFCLSNQQ